MAEYRADLLPIAYTLRSAAGSAYCLVHCADHKAQQFITEFTDKGRTKNRINKRLVKLRNVGTVDIVNPYPLTPTAAMGTAIKLKHPLLEQVKPSFVIFDIRPLTLRAERQSAQMSSLNPV